MEKKIVYRIFTIADYEREALYFREMHAKGWKLRKVSYSILLFAVKYTFFRKVHSEIESDAEFEIYNDAAGKLAMVNRILRLRLVPVLLLLAIHIPFLLKLLNKSNAYGLWSLFAVGLDIFLSLILLLIVAYISWKLWHKKKELSDL